MTERGQQHSDLVEIARRNGDFKRNYGTIIGAFLYLRSLSAARGRSFSWTGLLLGLIAATLPWLSKLGWRWP
jgi:hypothetical protein